MRRLLDLSKQPGPSKPGSVEDNRTWQRYYTEVEIPYTS